MKKLVTSEAVCSGHPDKVCDQIADAILDAIIEKDPLSRVACEVAIKTGTVFVAGEITTKATVDIQNVVRETIREIGYTEPEIGFDYKGCGIILAIDKQSADIAAGVDDDKNTGKSLGAGDQGIMFGYACNDTQNYMPLPIELARRIVNRLRQAREEKSLPYLRPDGKAQVTVEYDDSRPIRVTNVVTSAQHMDNVSIEKVREDIIEQVIKKVIPSQFLNSDIRYFVNPTGRFVEGGPKADSGMTGRKLIADTYGGVAHHGGGSFSGKDPTKVDRSATYAARHVAKNIVAAGLASRCEISLAYSIGVSEPIALAVETYGTGKMSDNKLTDMVRNAFNLTPQGMIDYYKLRRPIYKQTACYGHFGIEKPEYTWEDIEMVPKLRKLAGI